jgi:hypothetical protein
MLSPFPLSIFVHISIELVLFVNGQFQMNFGTSPQKMDGPTENPYC